MYNSTVRPSHTPRPCNDTPLTRPSDELLPHRRSAAITNPIPNPQATLTYLDQDAPHRDLREQLLALHGAPALTVATTLTLTPTLTLIPTTTRTTWRTRAHGIATTLTLTLTPRMHPK